MTTLVSSLNSQNCQMIYMAACLVCCVYFGRGPRSGEYLVFSDRGKSEWLILMHGVRSIVASERERIFTGILEPQDEGLPGHVAPFLQQQLSQHQEHIRRVRKLVTEEVFDQGLLETYLAAIDDLSTFFYEAFRVRSAGRHGLCLMAVTVGWIYRLPDLIVELVETKYSYSLIILAHWCVLLKYMGTSWLMVGWDKHVISGIMLSLKAEFRSHMEFLARIIYS